MPQDWGGAALFHGLWLLGLHLPAKKKNTPYLMVHSMGKKNCPMIVVRMKFTTVARAVPAARVCRG